MPYVPEFIAVETLSVKLRGCILALALALMECAGCSIWACAQQTPVTATAVQDDVIPGADLLQPADLLQMLNSQTKLLVLQVGSRVLYEQSHIREAEYVGAAGTPAGLRALRVRVVALKKDDLIVIYCGCCPWTKCPNIRAAYEQLHAMGFTRVKALYLGENFGVDWVSKGYPASGTLDPKQR